MNINYGDNHPKKAIKSKASNIFTSNSKTKNKFFFYTGFLLGKFVSHRQHKLRQLYEPEVIKLIRSILHAKQMAENVWDTEDTSITHFNNDSLPTTFGDSMLAFNLTNSNLLAKMKYCGQPISLNVLIDSDDVIAQLLNDEMVRLLNCLKEVNQLLDDLRNGIV